MLVACMMVRAAVIRTAVLVPTTMAVAMLVMLAMRAAALFCSLHMLLMSTRLMVMPTRMVSRAGTTTTMVMASTYATTMQVAAPVVNVCVWPFMRMVMMLSMGITMSTGLTLAMLAMAVVKQAMVLQLMVMAMMMAIRGIIGTASASATAIVMGSMLSALLGMAGHGHGHDDAEHGRCLSDWWRWCGCWSWWCVFTMLWVAMVVRLCAVMEDVWRVLCGGGGWWVLDG